MSITNNRDVQCECGVALSVFVADSINVDRHPHLRQAILEGTLHRFVCHACGRSVMVDAPFTYLDHTRRQVLFVVPRSELDSEEVAIAQAREAYGLSFGDRAPAGVQALGRGMLVRVCFGLLDLRDKIIADDAQLNDLLLEELKCLVLATQPALFELQIRALWLDRVEDDILVLIAESDGTDECRIVYVPRGAYDSLAREGAARVLARRPRLASGPHVSMLRLGLA